MIATLFTLTRESGALVGAGLVCPEARYASVRFAGAERLDRRFATPRDWNALEGELQSLPTTPLPVASAVVRALAGDRDVAVIYAVAEDITARPFDVVAALDAKLMAWPLGEPAPRT